MKVITFLILTVPCLAIGEESAEVFDTIKGNIFNLIKSAYENKDLNKPQLLIVEGVHDDEANRENAEVFHYDNSDTKLISFFNDDIPNVIVPSRRVDKIKELVDFLEDKNAIVPSRRVDKIKELVYFLEDKNAIVPSRRVDKIKELVDFLKDKPIALDYFYKQMHNIIKQRKTLSPLRKMVQILETEGNEKLRNRTIECFQKLWREEKIAEKKKYNDFWNVKTNNLNINYLRDPYNDNVLP